MKELNKNKRTLKSDRKTFINETISATDAKKEYDLTDEDLKKIGSIIKWGNERYRRESIFWYLKYGPPSQARSKQKALL